MTPPLITIALPVFNGEKTLRSAIRSILLQTYPRWELIIVDDGSQDDSNCVARTFRDPRIKVLQDGKRLGISARLNQILDMSAGAYFARMDADDISFPERLEKQVVFMEQNPAVDVVGAGVLVFRDRDAVLGRLPVHETHEAICRHPWNGFYLPHPTWLGKASWFKAYQYQSASDGAEDQHLLFRAYRYSRFACLPETLLGYREQNRSFLKMFRARRAFLRSNLKEATQNYRYGDACLLALSQSAKLAGDLLYSFFKLPGMRNRLLPVDAKLQSQWRSLQQQLDQGMGISLRDVSPEESRPG